jgi:pentatricopeptide repeat protein
MPGKQSRTPTQIHVGLLLGCIAFLIFAACSSSPVLVREAPAVTQGRLLFDKSSYQEAEAHFHKLLDTSRINGDSFLEAVSLKWLGNIQLAYRLSDQALNYYQESLSILDTLVLDNQQKGSDVPSEILTEKMNVQNNTGNVYIERANFDAAEKIFSEVLEYDRSRGDRLAIAVSLYNLGIVAKTRTNTNISMEDSTAFRRGMEKAKDLFYQSLAVFPTGDARYNLANVYALTYELDSAVFNMREALEFYTTNGYRNQQSLTLGNIGVLSYRNGDIEQAAEALAKAIGIIEELRGNVSSVEVRSSFISNKYYLYEYMIAALMKLGRMDEAFEYVERAKARSFLDLIGNKAIGKNKVRSPELEELISREENLQQRLSAIIDNPDSSDSYLELLEEYKTVIGSIEVIDPEYTSVVTIDPVPVKTLKGLMNDSSAVLEYFLGSFHAAIFLVTKDTLIGMSLDPQKLSDIGEKIEKLRRKLFFDFPNKKIQFLREQRLLNKSTIKEAYAAWYASEADGSWQYDLLNMHSLLVNPVQKHLNGISELFIVPHGPLHHLPFQALIENPGNIDRTKGVHVPRPRFWIEDMAISYLPSASVLEYARRKQGTTTTSALVIGDPVYADKVYRKQPLQGALLEADSVASLLNDPVVLKREEAEESVVKREIGNKDVIHFATHGELKKNEPMNSRILLAAHTPSGDNEGNLTVGEVFNLDLSASLVTLSACQTAQLSSGKGSFSAGDDLVGLTRSFMYAGTPSVIASLWYVDDKATLSWMVRFYKAWKEAGLSKLQASRHAAVSMLQNASDPDWVVPYYWSAFIFLGDYEQ